MNADMPVLLKKTDLCSRLNLSPRCLEMMVKSETFPPPVRIGKHVFWSELAVHRWQKKLFAAQEQWN